MKEMNETFNERYTQEQFFGQNESFDVDTIADHVTRFVTISNF